jgi:hypothetical protein
MNAAWRRAILTVALFTVTAAGLSACVVYDDRYPRRYNDRGYHTYDRDHDRDRDRSRDYDRRW